MRAGISALSNRVMATLLGATSMLAVSPVAVAQAIDGDDQQPSPADESMIGGGVGVQDIVVTAQRRSESLQKVPIAVTAATAETLETKGIKSTEDLNLISPSVNVQRTSGVGAIFIRGVGSNSRAPMLEPPIAFYVDGVYYPGALSSSSSFANIERIEILKGPQGTLFGRNSMGGLINVITTDPSDELTGHLKLGYANYDTTEGSFFVSGPVTTNLAADFAAYGYHQGNGWGTNLTTGGDVNFRKEYQLRSKIKWTPTENTTVTLSGDYGWNSTDIGATAMTLPNLPPPPASQELTFFRGSPYDSIANFENSGVLKNKGGYLRIAHDFDNFRVVNTSAYRKVTRYDVLDNDASPYTLSHATFFDSTKSYSNELQILGDDSARFQWQAGLFYFHSESGYQPQFIFSPALGAREFLRNFSDQTLDSYAVYGQVTFPLFSDATKVTLGGRYTIDNKDFFGTTDTALGRAATINDDKTEKRFTYRAAISHEFTPDILAYASIGTGFKSGYWNGSNPSQAPVDPELLTAYEAGLKTELFNRRVRLNVAGFYYDYTDLQLTQTRVTGAVNANAAAATVYGLEVEGEARLSSVFSIIYGVSLIDAKYDSYPDATSFVTNPLTGTGISTPIDNSGNDLQRTPDIMANIGFDYRIPVASGEFGLSGNWAYNDGFYFEPDNQYRQPAYSLFNFEVRWTDLDENYTIRAWAKNAFDKHFDTLLRTASGLRPYASPGAPRTYGVSAQFNF